MAFYKRADGEVLCAPNFVHAPTFSLLADLKDAYSYPMDGWTWFDTQEQAYAAFGIEPPKVQE